LTNDKQFTAGFPLNFQTSRFRDDTTTRQMIFKYHFVCSVILLSCSIAAAQTPHTTASLYNEPYRPQFHFSPERNWTNDPNGLVYHAGEYHLFYQYNPFGDKWGHMSWGHAVSPDLMHWKHLPVAIPELETSRTMIFSGSAVVDKDNTSGLGDPGKPVMVAVYTAHRDGNQSQALAYSRDNGRTWKQYEGNPVLDVGKQDFRDPKAFWHKATSQWIMAVALSAEKKISFYSSPDLKRWTQLSDFGPAGDSTAIWECPDLFELPVEGAKEEKRWVLMASVGRTMQYFIGRFDGKTFTNDNSPEVILRPDYGPDYFAAITFNDAPEEIGRIAIGWMSNWTYAGDIPTSPWRGAMSLPRQLTLKKTADGIRLNHAPVSTTAKLRKESSHVRRTGVRVHPEDTARIPINGREFELHAILEPKEAAEIGVKVATKGDQETIIGYDVQRSMLFVDRSRSGLTTFSKDFATSYSTPCKLIDGKLEIRVFVDRSSVEVFANGTVAMTALVFSDPASTPGRLYCRGGAMNVVSMEVWELKSVWE
jgi:fructan beta-fructosidase